MKNTNNSKNDLPDLDRRHALVVGGAVALS